MIDFGFVVYFTVAVLTSVSFCYLTNGGEDEAAVYVVGTVVGLTWPITIPLFLFGYLIKGIVHLINLVVEKIEERI